MTVMRRAVPTIAVTPSMLRHFAVLTVAITGCLAMFADGESRQIIEDELKARQAKNQALRADAQKGGKLRTVGGLKIAKGTKVDKSGDSAPNFDSAPDTGGSIDPAGRFSPVRQPPPAGLAYGANPALPGQPYMARGDGAPIGTPGVSARRPKAQPPRRPSQEEIEAIMAASRARSAGGSETDAGETEE